MKIREIVVETDNAIEEAKRRRRKQKFAYSGPGYIGYFGYGDSSSGEGGGVEEDTDHGNNQPLRLRANTDRVQKFIEAVYARYPQTFQNNHVMSWGEGEAQQLALFELVPSMSKRDAVDVKWFQAYPLRQGIGSRAMRVLQDMAREDGISLTLYPWDKGQISQAKLIKFYKSHGFKPTIKGSKNMVWEPVNEQGVAEGLSWSTLDEGLSLDDKMAIFEEYAIRGNLTESIDQDKKDYFISLFELSNAPVKNKKYIVAPLVLVGNRVMPLDKPAIMRFLARDHDVLVFDTVKGKKTYPSKTLRDLSVFNTFTFASHSAYDKFRAALSLKFDIGLPSIAQEQGVAEGRVQYKEIEFVCANPEFCDATDPIKQQQLYKALTKIPSVITLYQDQSEYSEGQKSLSAIYKDRSSRQKILALAKQLGVKVDLERPVSDDYVDRAIRSEHEGQQKVSEAWSEKYKRSINCNRPKGFSQRSHCQGRKKK